MTDTVTTQTLSSDYHDYLNDEGMIEADPKLMLGEENKPDPITKKDLLYAWFRGWWANEVPHTFDRMLGPSFCFGLIPVLRKLYKNKIMLGEAYQRHMMFFNTQWIWGGGLLTGITISLEEERARSLNAGDVDGAISSKIINSTKVGLIGPLAGIGDSIDSGTVQYIFIAMFLPLAQAGNPLGALLPWLFFTTATFIYGFLFCQMGYNLGRNAAREVMKGEKLHTIIDSLGVLGLFMMGILAASYVKLASPLAFSLSGKDFAIQSIIDNIVPGIVPLAAVLGLYWYFSKHGLKITKAMLWYTAILIVLAVIGIL